MSVEGGLVNCAKHMVALWGLVALATVPACTGRSTTGASTTSTADKSTTVLQSDEVECRSSGLALTAGHYGEAGGQFIQTFTFTNITPTRCRLGGWPGFQLADASGHLARTETRRVRQNAPPAAAWRPVVLAPHGAASFDVFGADFDVVRNVSCPKTYAAAILAPNDTSRMSVRVQIPECGAFYIAPLIAGRTDRAAWSFVVR